VVAIKSLGSLKRNAVALGVVEADDKEHVHLVIDFHILGEEVHGHDARTPQLDLMAYRKRKAGV